MKRSKSNESGTFFKVAISLFVNASLKRQKTDICMNSNIEIIVEFC